MGLAGHVRDGGRGRLVGHFGDVEHGLRDPPAGVRNVEAARDAEDEGGHSSRDPSRVPALRHARSPAFRVVFQYSVALSSTSGSRRAKIYGNEARIGEAIQEAIAAGEVTRSELFVTTKLWNTDHESALVACRDSLTKLKLDYLDLYLIHCPFTNKPGPELEPPLHETWGQMEDAKALGLARSVGVSNFSLKKLDLLQGDVVPAVNQVEMHPLLRQDALLQGCLDRGIHVTAYSPLGSRDSMAFMQHDGQILMDHPTVRAAAVNGNCSPAQALLKWGIARRTSVLPKSATPARIKENADVFATPLPQEDVDALSALEPQHRFLHMKSCLHPNGPYKTLAEFWDEPAEASGDDAAS